MELSEEIRLLERKVELLKRVKELEDQRGCHPAFPIVPDSLPSAPQYHPWYPATPTHPPYNSYPVINGCASSPATGENGQVT